MKLEFKQEPTCYDGQKNTEVTYGGRASFLQSYFDILNFIKQRTLDTSHSDYFFILEHAFFNFIAVLYKENRLVLPVKNMREKFNSEKTIQNEEWPDVNKANGQCDRTYSTL